MTEHGTSLRRVRALALFVMIVALIGVAAVVAPDAHASTTFTVNSTTDPGDGTCDATECTLREAINDANSTAGSDTIAFNIPGAPPYSIQPLTSLPTITEPVVVDATTQPGFVGTPIVELDGSAAGPTGSGFTLDADSSVVRGFVINRFAPAANQPGGGVDIRFGGNNVVEGNYIGTDVTGTIALGNSSGVFITGPGGNRVGGTTPAARNIIADNKAPNGAGVWTVSSNNVIQGNYIGLDHSGTMALGNGFGLVITGTNNLIGGTSSGSGNVISGNRDAGLEICENCGAFPTTANSVQGNYIGTDASGTASVPNIDNFGGAVLVRAPGNMIGGIAPGAGNLISGNNGDGVIVGFLFGNPPPANNNLLAANLIGTTIDGVTPLGNTGHGVHIGFISPASQNTIGGVAAAAANTIANNDGAGVFVESNSNQNAILGNSIHSNGLLGIDLNPAGPTPNDPADTDAGANDLQNFPALTSFSSSGGTTTVQGTLNSTPSTAFRVEFFSSPNCDLTGFGEGQVFLGSASVSTDGSGNASFTATVPTGTNAGDVLTMTATDPANNTSEFSSCSPTVGPGPPATLTLSPKTATNTVGTSHTVTATVKDASGTPVSGVTVRFSVTGANNASGSQTTDVNGQASFTYTGTVVGSDAISAFADTDGNGSQNGSEPGDTAAKTWIAGPPASLTLSPKTATNVVDMQHCVTATVKDASGNPVSGITVRFTVTGASNTMASRVTDANGQATFCYQGPAFPGSDAIKAFADTDLSGGQNGTEPSDTASKTWTLPAGSAACKVTNGGGIVAANGDTATFGGNAQDGPKGNEEYQDHGPATPMNVKASNVQTIVCSADMKSASIFGQATINGAGAFSYRIDVRDLGEPGRTDTYRIRLSNGYDSGDKVLSQGNIQIHK